MPWQDIIILDPAAPAGKPVIRNTRLSVDFIVGLLGQGWAEAKILEKRASRVRVLTLMNLLLPSVWVLSWIVVAVLSW